jgi:hypothetical protein
MNFHTFVLISTIVFYIILRMYKRNVNDTNTTNPTDIKKRKSNLLYVLFLPVVMYFYHFMYGETNVIQHGQSGIANLQQPVLVKNDSIFNSIKSSEPLLTSPFPESSISISTSSSK